MPRKRMSESEAWREIARRIAEGEWDEGGLCGEVHRIGCRLCFRSGRLVTEKTRVSMVSRIDSHLAPRAVWGFTPGVAKPRVLAALWLALEAEEEEAHAA